MTTGRQPAPRLEPLSAPVPSEGMGCGPPNHKVWLVTKQPLRFGPTRTKRKTATAYPHRSRRCGRAGSAACSSSTPPAPSATACPPPPPPATTSRPPHSAPGTPPDCPGAVTSVGDTACSEDRYRVPAFTTDTRAGVPISPRTGLPASRPCAMMTSTPASTARQASSTEPMVCRCAPASWIIPT